MADEVRGPRVSDEEFFNALDLDRPALAAVKVAVAVKDWPAAEHALAEHFRTRRMPIWNYSRREVLADQEKVDPRIMAWAERFARNELRSVDIWHAFGEDIDWTFNPSKTGNREWTWQVNRHGCWRTLGQAYRLTGDEKYARAFVRQMRDWVVDCPVPVEKADQGTGSRWRTIEAGIRMGGPWPDVFYYILPSPSFTDADICLMVKSFVEHARYLTRFKTGANWLMMESNGLYHVGALFPEFREAGQWRATAIGRLYDEMEIQVYPDGAQYELSTGYHQATLKNAEASLLLAKLNGYEVPADFVKRMEKMYDYNLYMARPNWQLPSLNDGAHVDVAAYSKIACELFPERKDYLYAATLGQEGTPPKQTSHAFDYAGFLVMRDGWKKDSLWGYFEVGPFGLGHQHEDKLNFLIHAYGSYLLIDPGNYHYDRSKWRQEYIYRSYAHNVVHVDGLEQYRRGRPRDQYVVDKPVNFVWQSNPRFDYAVGSYGEPEQERYGAEGKLPAVVIRHVLFVKPVKDGKTAAARGGWLVFDVYEPTDEKAHHYEAMFHLDVPEAAVDGQGRVLTDNGDAANLVIVPASGLSIETSIIKGQEEPVIQGWIPAEGYEVRPIPTAVFEKKTAGKTLMAWCFYPIPPGEKMPDIELQADRDVSGKICLTAQFPDGTWQASIEGEQVKIVIE